MALSYDGLGWLSLRGLLPLSDGPIINFQILIAPLPLPCVVRNLLEDACRARLFTNFQSMVGVYSIFGTQSLSTIYFVVLLLSRFVSMVSQDITIFTHKFFITYIVSPHCIINSSLLFVCTPDSISAASSGAYEIMCS